MRQPPTSVRLIFVRHGPTSWNLAGRYQGRTDTALDPAGLEEARGAGAALRCTRASLVLTSPLQRARATAEVISRCLGLIPCRVDERLVELGFGEWEGLTQAQVRGRWPALLREWKRVPQSVRFPGGETLRDGQRRMEEFLRHPPWTDHASPHSVVVVTHSGPIRFAALFADGRPLADYRQVPLQASAARQFDWDPPGRLRPVGLFPLT
jgi:broad specificity phosphatase PhoE